jgi:hypothetical protein
MGSSQAEVTFKHNNPSEKLIAVIGVVDMLEKKIKAFRLQMADCKTEGDVVGTCGINCLEANSRWCGTCGHILVCLFVFAG